MKNLLIIQLVASMFYLMSENANGDQNGEKSKLTPQEHIAKMKADEQPYASDLLVAIEEMKKNPPAPWVPGEKLVKLVGAKKAVEIHTYARASVLSVWSTRQNLKSIKPLEELEATELAKVGGITLEQAKAIIEMEPWDVSNPTKGEHPDRKWQKKK